MSDERKDGGAAFPTAYVLGENQGMSLRDYFAAKAMQGILSNIETMRQGTRLADCMTGEDALPTLNALLAYSYADAMLKARDA